MSRTRYAILLLLSSALVNTARCQLGPLDVSFGNNGLFTTGLLPGYQLNEDMALQADGKVVMAGTTCLGQSFDGFLIRLTTSGVLDTSFSQDGMVFTGDSGRLDRIMNVAVLADGDILAMGDRAFPYSGTATMRLNTDGSIDTTYGSGGVELLSTTIADNSGMQLLPDGRVLVAGSNNAGVLLEQIMPDGSPDPTFGNAGLLQLPCVQGSSSPVNFALSPDGRVFVTMPDFVDGDHVSKVFCVFGNGTLDNSYGNAGCATVNWTVNPVMERLWTIALDASGRIMLGGTVFENNTYKYLVARLTVTGVLDTSFGQAGFAANQPGDPCSRTFT